MMRGKGQYFTKFSDTAICQKFGITVKYFEIGHTFMSTDSVHHEMVWSMKDMSGGNIYDYQDFVTAAENSNECYKHEK